MSRQYREFFEHSRNVKPCEVTGEIAVKAAEYAGTQKLSNEESLRLAKAVYEQNILNFQNGSCDITTLSSSQTRLLNAQNQYITSMRDYWSCYYEIRSQTLFDFITNSPLNIDAAYGDVGF